MRYLYFAVPPVVLVLLGLAILSFMDLAIVENLDRLLIMFIGGLIVGSVLYLGALLTIERAKDDQP